MKYATIVADPPWQYDKKTNGRGGNAAAERHYPTMALAEIAALPVVELAEDNAHLYLWVTNPFLMDAATIIRAWGFQYKGCLTWCKAAKDFNQPNIFEDPPRPQWGTGYYFRSATEHLLFAVRGAMATTNHSTATWFMTPRLAHSVKPDESYDLIERCSPGPFLELFARRKRPGWHVWGNQVESDIAL